MVGRRRGRRANAVSDEPWWRGAKFAERQPSSALRSKSIHSKSAPRKRFGTPFSEGWDQPAWVGGMATTAARAPRLAAGPGAEQMTKRLPSSVSVRESEVG